MRNYSIMGWGRAWSAGISKPLDRFCERGLRGGCSASSAFAGSTMFDRTHNNFPRRDSKPKKRLRDSKPKCRLVVLESLLGFRVSSGEFLDRVKSANIQIVAPGYLSRWILVREMLY